MNPTVASEHGMKGDNRRGSSRLGMIAREHESTTDRLDGSVRAREMAPVAAESPASRPKIIQRIDDPSPEAANRQALEELHHGADGLAIVFEGAPNAFGHGLPATAEALATALRDVPLTRTHLRLDVHPQSRASIDWLVQILGARRVSPDRLDISFGFDPASLFAGSGRLRMSIEALLASMPQSLAHFFALAVPGILLEADGRVFHNAGATDAQELGVMLASALSYLRMFEDARQPVLYAAAHIGFSVSIDQDHRRSRAKLRALRDLWGRVLESYSVPPIEATIHAETSYRMLTSRAPETNVARSMIAAMAAIDAGVSSLSLLPPALPSEFPDARSRRAARNTLLVLGEEAKLAARTHAADADVVALASEIGEQAWLELRRIEDEGGVLRSLHEGRIQQRIAESRAALAASLREGESRIVGTTLHATKNGRRMAPSVPVRTLTEDGVVFCEPLPVVRLEELLQSA
jgi:methylmalonyl-CoA mutase